MKYVDEFRDAQLAAKLLAAIRRSVTRRWIIMEVCGGQTHSLLRYGIEDELKGVVDLLHGPGCPVCVTPIQAIDSAVTLALQPNTTLASFGDMLRVPGTHRSLAQIRSEGGQVNLVYSPLDAVEFAKRHPQRQVVFFGVGFESTIPSTALAIQQAAYLGLNNFSVLCAHVRILPAMEQILQAPHCKVDGFLAAGHVCTVIGYESYQSLIDLHHVPVVVTGFEPIDLLMGIYECVVQLESGNSTVTNGYGRSVSANGNPTAIQIIDELFETKDRPWRGLGVIPHGGYELRDRWREFDARYKFSLEEWSSVEPTVCPSGEILTGKLRPPQCPHFAKSCTPEQPLGAPMVSAEGACAAYFRYQANNSNNEESCHNE